MRPPQILVGLPATPNKGSISRLFCSYMSTYDQVLVDGMWVEVTSAISSCTFFYSSMKTRFLESRPGVANLNCVDRGNSWRVETLRMGDQRDGRSLGLWQPLRAQLPASWSFMRKKKKSYIFFKPLLAWVSVTNSFICVLINSKGNKNWWMKMIHTQMVKTCSINIISHLDFTSFI